jgi:SAM-dependent methyltransferase
MPELGWNRLTWDGAYDWRGGGEEWSEAWGNSEAQWFGSLYPRLHRLLPVRTALEIAPGFGRWTRFLIDACEHYTGIDLSRVCVDHCRHRFADCDHATFVQNDGLSLAAAPGGLDFVFSFDSLVHCEVDVFAAYIPQLLAKLSETGIVFLHHSNLRACAGLEANPHNRAQSVSAQDITDLVVRSGGTVHIQEIINWGGDDLIDCLTTFGISSQQRPGHTVTISNGLFMREAELIRDCQSPYSRTFRNPKA